MYDGRDLDSLDRTMKPIPASGYCFVEPGHPLEKKDFEISVVQAYEVVVKVAGCGLCHTDLSFYTGQVTPHQKPVILGHEISGEVVAAGTEMGSMLGRQVIVPAVLPCGDCQLCKIGRDNICQHQKMPGNDFNGGFSTHLTVPGRFLCPLPEDLGNFQVFQLSVIADAVTTPYQALLRSHLQAGDLAIVIGVGGIGNYMAQHCVNAGAKVVALDVDPRKLQTAEKMGTHFTLNVAGLADSEIRKAVRSLVKEKGLPTVGWRVFETSGTAAGQAAAFALLSFAGTLGYVGFTMEKISVRLSNLMAFDADAFGNWGCRPEYYGPVLKEVLSGKINLRDNIEQRPLDTINEVLSQALDHQLEKRVIFVP